MATSKPTDIQIGTKPPLLRDRSRTLRWQVMKTESVCAIVGALREAEVRYLIVGGLAVAAHGYLRYTVDVDLVIALDADNVRRCVHALAGLGYRPLMPVSAEGLADTRTREEWVRDKGMVVFQLVSELHPETRVDIFATEPFDFDTEYGRAAKLHLPGNLEAPVISLEELFVMKTAANRPKDKLDMEYLRNIRRLASE